jgi:hypothetical protein
MTADATIDYEALHQEALRGLVRSVLTEVAKSGLPGEHHFYISYDVRSPGVGLSKRLREKYPTEMTIVLQHRFWDLSVNDDRFEVKLTFDGIPERLVVPFSAIKVFLDPSVRFVLHFEDAAVLAEREFNRDLDGEPVEGRPATPRKRAPRAKPRADKPNEPSLVSTSAVSPSLVPAAESDGEKRVPLTMARPKSQPSLVPATPPADESGDKAGDGDKPAANGSGAQVVSLDAFRKK